MRPEVLILILLCALVTVIPRVVPLMLIGRVQYPPVVVAWLRHIPIAVITALLCQDTLLRDSTLPTTWMDARLLAGLITLILAFITRSILLTVILGMAVYVLLRFWLGH